MTVRPWTPSGPNTVAYKRACNGCGHRLGDVTDRELQGATLSRKLPDVRHECGTCNGHHVLCVTPEEMPAGLSMEEQEAWRNDPDVTYSVICPHRGKPIADRPCVMYRACGCEAPARPTVEERAGMTHDQMREADATYYAEIERRADQPCPKSPTGEHRWFPHAGFLAPTDQCFVADNDTLSDAGSDVSNGKPGRYPVEFDVEDDSVVLLLLDPMPQAMEWRTA